MMQTSPQSSVLEDVRLTDGSSKTEGVKRRVFFLLDSLQIGGTETQAVELALRLDPALYSVTLGCLQLRGPLLQKFHGSKVSLVEFHVDGGIDSPNGIYQILRLANFLRKNRFDVVHAHDLWSNLMGIPAARLAGVPAIISSRRDLSHLPWYTPLKRRFLRRLQQLSSAVLVNSREIQNHLVKDDKFEPELIRVVYNGIDLKRFDNVVADRSKLFPALEGCTLIVTTGNMRSDIKGHPTLIEAARSVCARFPNARFVLIGDGESRQKFESKVADLGLGEKFLFLGSRQDVPELLSCCDIAVMPSRAEGFSNALLEYLAARLPTVATQVGGNVEIIQHRVNGLLVLPENPADLAAAISCLLQNPTLASQLGYAGRERVRASFSFEQLTKNTDALYTELLRARR